MRAARVIERQLIDEERLVRDRIRRFELQQQSLAWPAPDAEVQRRPAYVEFSDST